MNKVSIKFLLMIFAISLVTVIATYISFSSEAQNKNANAIVIDPHANFSNHSLKPHTKKLAYIVSDMRIPFWSIMARGIDFSAAQKGYDLEIYSAENSRKSELEFVAKAIRENVSGIIVSPTASSACATILKLADNAGIPVVISDIGTDGGDYVAYISSNNKEGAYEIGKVLAQELHLRGWETGRVGIIAIPQKRLNGQLRTAGFMEAMDEYGIKGADIRQQITFSYEETYHFAQEMIKKYPDLRALWLQGSDRYQAALDAIADEGKKGQILLATFDAEPEFLELIPKGILVGSAMQQPYLMGQEALYAMDDYLNGKKVEKSKQLPILAISTHNIKEKLPLIQRNVLGMERVK
ncbi:substrate-binding domain-containing protein [Sulfuricurvum sp.]|uniref:substrate-binding domain-containing protein n=1 Tax=Sulfuricurvum sp. TaxID=2025608 RepID=UPI00262BF71D|nr:substrate-binding domain-containing protein [Sulfuricurvum sp.]MDD2780896.1 substrate-binding domain-containing protein [Sulfuricurvum sp.]